MHLATLLMISFGFASCSEDGEKSCPEPVARFSYAFEECEGQSCLVTSNLSEEAISYEWDFGDGSEEVSTTDVELTHTYDKPGTYIVILRVIGCDDVTDMALQEVLVPEMTKSELDFEITSEDFYAPCELAFSSLYGGQAEFEWDFGDSEGASSATPSHTYREAGMYTVSLSAVSGTQTLTVEKTIEIKAASEELPIPPASYELDLFYKKYVDALGIPVISSEKVPDEAIYKAQELVTFMLQPMPEVVTAMIENKARMAIMADTELTTDIPEHSDLTPKDYWDQRARGLGGTIYRPATSCAEENLLCYDSDSYWPEDITIHEFSHAIDGMGLRYAYEDFESELEATYQSAIDQGLWADTYAATNKEEYWAEGVQSWFNVNTETSDGQADGVHNHVNTRSELEEYDATLYALIARYFTTDYPDSCHLYD